MPVTIYARVVEFLVLLNGGSWRGFRRFRGRTYVLLLTFVFFNVKLASKQVHI